MKREQNEYDIMAQLKKLDDKVNKWHAEIKECIEWEITQFQIKGIDPVKYWVSFFESEHGVACGVYKNGKVEIYSSLHKPLKYTSLKGKLRKFRNQNPTSK